MPRSHIRCTVSPTFFAGPETHRRTAMTLSSLLSRSAGRSKDKENFLQTAAGEPSAVSQQHSEVVRVLVEHGADVHAVRGFWSQHVYAGLTRNASAFVEPATLSEEAQGGNRALTSSSPPPKLASVATLFGGGVKKSHPGPCAERLAYSSADIGPSDAGGRFRALEAQVGA